MRVIFLPSKVKENPTEAAGKSHKIVSLRLTPYFSQESNKHSAYNTNQSNIPLEGKECRKYVLSRLSVAFLGKVPSHLLVIRFYNPTDVEHSFTSADFAK